MAVTVDTILDCLGGFPFRCEIKDGKKGVLKNIYQFKMDDKVYREFTGPDELDEALTSILIKTYLRGVTDAVNMHNTILEGRAKKASS